MSNNVIVALNLSTLLLSVPVLAGGVWLRSRADGTGCDHSLSTPATALAAALVAVSLAGLLGACCRATWLLWLYLLATLALILALLCFTAFSFAVVIPRPRGAAGEYYSTWLRRHVEGPTNWARIRTCLAGAGVCKHLEGKKATTTMAQLVGGGLSSVESGCCKPPTSCNFTYAGGTEWTKPAAATSQADPDCGKWEWDEEDKLCFGCQSCKDGVVDALRRDWKRAAIVDAVFLAFIVVVYSVGCCAFRNSRLDNYAYHSSRGWKRSGHA
ncbi:hypothetical protein HU200_005355 [Digitaria exilis]|uniref:Uncharacterized protein n=1 Tax=Digitaria exilis TaxID=1010633 RepID=A0A835KRQ0_9POAL|nr:hypothetical protein HU200_005355 [Digitaria exilis]CAB3481098.1 unnamed protein product [Digitaria exilis]